VRVQSRFADLFTQYLKPMFRACFSIENHDDSGLGLVEMCTGHSLRIEREFARHRMYLRVHILDCCFIVDVF
jgi:hypothetical protein